MTSDLPETDDELLMRMRSGDEQAFVALYRRRQAAIYRFALHMSGSGTVAEDVTQEVFLALIREECGFDPERGTLSGYLFGIARKLVLRHMERGRSEYFYALGIKVAGLDDPEPTAWALRKVELEYIRPARVGDLIRDGIPKLECWFYRLRSGHGRQSAG